MIAEVPDAILRRAEQASAHHRMLMRVWADEEEATPLQLAAFLASLEELKTVDALLAEFEE